MKKLKNNFNIEYSMSENKVYIILVNYNGWKDTLECLESLLKIDYPAYQIIIIDNNSPDNSVDRIVKWAIGKQDVIYDEKSKLKHLTIPNIKKPVSYIIYSQFEALKGGDVFKEKQLNNPIVIIKADENGGFAYGNNIGIKYALAKDDFDSIILLNNDTVVDRDAIKNIMNAKKQHGDAAIYGGRILYYDKPDVLWYDGGYFSEWLGKSKHKGENKKIIQGNDISRVNFITFCFVLIPKLIIKQIGLIDESYFMYVEDLDYCYKVFKRGYNLYHVYNSLVWHKIGASYGGGTSFFSSYLYYRNSLIFRMKMINNYKRYIAILYYFLRLPILALKWLIINPDIFKSLILGTYDAMKYTKNKNVRKIGA